MPLIAAVLVVALGGALRFEALVTRYWEPQGAPSWALRTRDSFASLHPRGFAFVAEAQPYAGDPFSYLRFAREARGFYDAHVREPAFLAAARLGLHLSGGREIGLNFASALFGTVLVGASLLLGARVASPWVGVGAAARLAIERRAVRLSVEGWRDDTHAAFAILAAWALLGLLRGASRRQALLAGGLCAAACLTRLTSVVFLLPAWAFIALWGQGGRQQRLRALGLCAGVTLVLLAPYLVNCAVAFGDPFYAVNYHASDFSRRAGLPHGGPTGVAAFLASLQGPYERLDTLWLGLTSVPFASKWTGFRNWSPWLGPGLAWTAVLGLSSWTLRTEGRFLLVLLGGLLLPYAMLWEIPGGGNWRYTLPVYPFYLIAACAACGRLTALTARGCFLSLGREAFQIAGVAAAGLLLANLLQYARVEEGARRRRGARIEVGPRDGLILVDGWSWPQREGNIRLRHTQRQAGLITLPLPGGTDLALRLRLYVRGPSGRVSIHLDGAPLASFAAPEGAQIGNYLLALPSRPTAHRARLRLEAAPGETIFLWYLRLEGPAPAADPETEEP